MTSPAPKPRDPRTLRLPPEDIEIELADKDDSGMAWAPVPITDEMAFRTECMVDGKPIEMMAFKGTGVCSEYCRKVRDGEIVDERLS